MSQHRTTTDITQVVLAKIRMPKYRYRRSTVLVSPPARRPLYDVYRHPLIGPVVRGLWWCCGGATRIPHTIHYAQVVAYSNSIHIRTAGWCVPRAGCMSMPRIPFNVAPHSVPRAASGTYLLQQWTRFSGLSTKTPVTIPIHVHTFRSVLWNTEKYRNQIPASRFPGLPENTVATACSVECQADGKSQKTDRSVYDDGIHHWFVAGCCTP